ncbi:MULTISPECIES: MraY family glycosyltransferase [unclassified Granulicatella]|uniref:MraY family glycosyltransferase n=1 Tax=unclassified Granulicatella TaxID=2630493 RepID=UPI0010741420|nr:MULTISPECIES: MraY family glycosyltransferase [unclassified Granulicatella]MBF0780244.1 undecaprenyl/decaprenyl-phosphate alpha-N-acetylglucosaminyl 1-phosphate transferase [Granulicatella sp. 19428wC4_WM01]TFU95625.1 undecaprenyl/decaprenyl-phosphate alpha-N-acetylglucosaminyl 1-phosphate transferase [Granulicatella sp. WM01]
MSFQMGFFLVFIGVTIISYIGIDQWCIFARKKGFFDTPNARKMHSQPIVTMGGVVIFLVYWLSILFITLAFDLVVREQIPLFIASTIIFITGVLDDLYDISPKQKSVGIILGASVVYWTTDFKIYSVFEQLFGVNMMSELIGYIVTLVWIYYITNAFNLIDGLDGLSTGVSIIALSAISFISYFFSPVSVFILTTMVLLLVATLLGFLPHNFHPARVFIGDTGILFIGFMVSVFALMGMQKPGIVAIITPIIILGVPLTDATFAIFRRLLKGESITKADRSHIHHRLMLRGVPHARAVVSIYGVALVFASVALAISLADNPVDIYVTLALTIIGEFIFVDYLNLLDLKEPLLFKRKNH